jgi:hypothetical protein
MSSERSAITITVEPVASSGERALGQVFGRDSAGVGLLLDSRPLEARVPDLIEPVVGFRNWRIFRNGPRDGELSSPYLPVSWTERVHRAECRRRGSAEELLQEAHRAPAAGCGCGISAYHEPTGQFSKIDYRAVSGIVTVWGAIQVDGEEMRAEVARIEALALYHRWNRNQVEAVRTIADNLGTDLVDLRELGAAAERYGRGLPPSVLAEDRPANLRDRFAAVFTSRVGD